MTGGSDGSFASFFSRLDRAPAGVSADSGYYTAPNEELPQKALPIYRASPAGAYVAVGTERGFLGAANSPRATHLLLIDSEPGITRYNRINIALLRASADRRHYLTLRLTPEPGPWREAAGRGLPDDLRGLLEDPGVHRWWRRTMAFRPTWWNPWSFIRQRSFARFHAPPEGPADAPRVFDGVNYLFEDGLFARLRGLARAGAVQAVTCDIRDAGAMEVVVDGLRRSGVGLGILDLSNLWWPAYMPAADFAVPVRAFDGLASPDSILLTTALSPPIPWGFYERLAYRTFIAWDYRGFTFRHIRSWPSCPDFVRSLRWGWARSRSAANGLTC